MKNNIYRHANPTLTMTQVVELKEIETMLRKIVREELEEILKEDYEIKPSYIEKLKKIEQEEHIKLDSLDNLDSLIKNV